jgi:hypothetical protein
MLYPRSVASEKMAWVSDTVFSLLVCGVAFFGLTTAGFAVAWLRARERAIRAEHVPARDGAGRVQILERELDAMALELNRVDESQQFVQQLLEGRTQTPPRTVATSLVANR